jgi:signal transduction histidine kinase
VTLPIFIRAHIEPITAEWETFARVLAPASGTLSADELRDHVPDLLRAIADDIEHERTDEQSRQRSRGSGGDEAPGITRYSREHAATRLKQGFSLQSLGAEYRALRESVLHLWHLKDDAGGERALKEQLRFSQAIDQSWTKAVAWYEEQLDLARDFMLGALGHDLRNPLGTVQMSARVLLQDPALSGESVKAAMRVFNSSVRMRELVDQLLDFTRIRLGHRLPVNLVLCDLEHVLDDIADELRIQHPSAVLQVDCQGELTGAWDSGRIAQMLSNLLGNAIEHGAPDTPVTVFADTDGNDVVVVISNQGTAIPREQLQRIFELPPVTDPASSSAIATRRLGLRRRIRNSRRKTHERQFSEFF